MAVENIPDPSQAAESTERQPAQEQARALWQDAKQGARSMLDEQKHTAASSIGDIAATLRSSASDLGGRNQPMIARMAECAADGLEQVSGALQRRDLDGLIRETESYARRQPMVFFGAAVVAGFLAIRFLKSTSQTNR